MFDSVVAAVAELEHTEKMLTYAIGRELTVHDRSEIAAITERLASRGHGLCDLVELIALSNAFRE